MYFTGTLLLVVTTTFIFLEPLMYPDGDDNSEVVKWQYNQSAKEMRVLC